MQRNGGPGVGCCSDSAGFLAIPRRFRGPVPWFLGPSPLGARGGHVKLASPKASKRIAWIPQRPKGPHRSAPPGLQGLPGAARRKMRDDAFL